MIMMMKIILQKNDHDDENNFANDQKILQKDNHNKNNFTKE